MFEADRPMKKARLIREQTEAKLQRIIALRDEPTPAGGWVRALRAALNMTAARLANRIGVHREAISRIEKDEIAGSVSIKTMRRVAEGLDCVFVYALVPKTTLDATVRAQAQRLAFKRLSQASHTMALEDQALSDRENREVLSRLIDDIMDDPPASLWEVE